MRSVFFIKRFTMKTHVYFAQACSWLLVVEDDRGGWGDDYWQVQQLEWSLLEMIVNTALVLASVLKHVIQSRVFIVIAGKNLIDASVFRPYLSMSYPLFQINIDKWRALRGEPLLTRCGPHLSLDISYWQDGPRRICGVFAPRCEIWLRILVVGRRWRVVHIVITNQERVISDINLSWLVSVSVKSRGSHGECQNRWIMAAVKNSEIRGVCHETWCNANGFFLFIILQPCPIV